MFQPLRCCRFAVVLVALSLPCAVPAADEEPAAAPAEKTTAVLPPDRTGEGAGAPKGEPAAARGAESPPYGVGFEARQRSMELGKFGSAVSYRSDRHGGGRGRGRGR